MIGEFFRGLMPGQRRQDAQPEATKVVPAGTRPQDVREDLISYSRVDVRASHAAMDDEAWVKRIVQETDLPVEAPEAFRRQVSLTEELAGMPPEGMKRARHEDAPPPPLGWERSPTVPKHVYSNGVVWTVGDPVGSGAFGQVFEITHSGAKQRKRLVKLMCAGNDAEHRGRLWNEVGANMFAGDFVGSEVLQEDGKTWMALVLERHDGETAWTKVTRDREAEREEFDGDPRSMLRAAMMVRSVVHMLRRMHAAGWTHRDVKPNNIIYNTNDGEEALSRLIDYGAAERVGNVRKRFDGLIIGTPKFMFPEAAAATDVDTRQRDYWGAMITAAYLLRLVKDRRTQRVEDVVIQLQQGTYYEAPRLDDDAVVREFFSKHGLGKAQQDFVRWLYAFLRPLDSVEKRARIWLERGITKMVDVDVLPVQGWSTRGDYDFDAQAAFLDDDKFVRELDSHIRALAKEVGRQDDIGKTLELLQEFPAS